MSLVVEEAMVLMLFDGWKCGMMLSGKCCGKVRWSKWKEEVVVDVRYINGKKC